MISIIVPVYNAENYLDDCIISVVKQDDFSLCELILVDDGSKDGSADICRKYAEKYDNITYFFKENGGVSSARNKGIDLAKGEYIFFLDSDDMLTDNGLKIMSEAKKSDFTAFSVKVENEGVYNVKSEMNSILTVLLNIGNSEHFGGSRLCSTCSKLLKAEIIKQNHLSYNEKIINGEDMLFNLVYVSKCKNISLIKSGIYIYRNNLSSSTKSYHSDAISSDMHFLFKLKEILLSLGDNYYNEYYNRKVFDGFKTCMGSFISHKDNPMKMSQKSKMIKKMIEDEPYCLIKTMESKELKTKILQIMLKMKLYSFVVILFKLSRKQNSNFNKEGLFDY